jgi:anti-sigma B factor antagonist
MASLEYPIEMVNGVPVVAAPAEIDIRNADWLDAVLREASARGHGTFVVDMTGTIFCESSGVGVLAQAHKRALAEGDELRLVIPASALVLRKFAVIGIDRVIPNFPSLYEALEPAPATAPGHLGRGGAPSRGCAPTQASHRPILAPSPAGRDGHHVSCPARAVSN